MILHLIKINILLVLFSLGSAVVQKQTLGATEHKWSFDGQLCLKYSYQKLLKSDHPSLSYNRYNLGVFFIPHSVLILIVLAVLNRFCMTCFCCVCTAACGKLALYILNIVLSLASK